MRILVTGSRKWRSRTIIEEALLRATIGVDSAEVTVIHGNNGNADRLAAAAARKYGFTLEPHDVNWDVECRPGCGHVQRFTPLGKPWCPAAGNYRNQEMVDTGADLCLAFFNRGQPNRGTSDCARRADRAGIRVTRFYEG